MRGKIEHWRRAGYNDAADNLERSLEGKGGIVPVSREQALKFKHIQKGEAENNRRFVEQTLLARDTHEKSALALRDLKDGETLEVRACS